MATGPLRFRTPQIEEIPITQTRQAPGFAYVAVDPTFDPARAQLKPNSAKRSRTILAGGLGGQTEAQKEAASARKQREIQRRIDALSADNSKDVNIPIPKKAGETKVGGQRDGKTTNTKKVLASGKTFAHYLDDEEAELARTGGVRVVDVEVAAVKETKADSARASKMPLARRRAQEEKRASVGGGASSTPSDPSALRRESTDLRSVDTSMPDLDEEDESDGLAPMISRSELEALLNAPPLPYNQARSAPPPSEAPPPRTFCDMCGYWGRMRCMKCGSKYCSVRCKDVHDKDKCLKFYA